MVRSKRIKIPSKKKIAFVCSGGGAKAGAFHLGVALALQEQGFKFYGGLRKDQEKPRKPGPMEISTYVGSSAGSIIATILAAGFSLENVFESFLLNKKSGDTNLDPKPLPRLTYQKMLKLRTGLAKEQIKQLMLVKDIVSNMIDGNWESLLQAKWLRTTGLFSTAGIEQYLREEVLESNDFKDYLADLFVTATQLNHSRKVIFGKYHYKPPVHDPKGAYYNDKVSISEACACSTALPFIYSPYLIKEPDGSQRHYIDGEIRDTLSTHVAVDSGSDLVFASYTHQPYHMVKEIGSLTEIGLPSILVQSLYLLIEQKINQSVHNKKCKQNAIIAVENYCKQQGIDADVRKRIYQILEKELMHRTEVDMIYIHPRPTDTNMFVQKHFSLSPKVMSEIVKSGFRAAIDVLRKYEFADYSDDSAVNTAQL